MCKHCTFDSHREKTDSDMESVHEQGAKLRGSPSHHSQGGGRRVVANFHSSAAKPEQQQFLPQTGARKQSQRQKFSKKGLQKNNDHKVVVESTARRHHGHGANGNDVNENTRLLKRHSTVQRASPSKHLHMLSNNTTIASSYGDQSMKNTSPVPSTKLRSSPVPLGTTKVYSQPAYAGAKFSDPPSPKVLPKPPLHWVSPPAGQDQSSCAEMTSVLKVMLKVQA